MNPPRVPARALCPSLTVPSQIPISPRPSCERLRRLSVSLRNQSTPLEEMEPTITGAMLQRAKGPELVSHLKARASATNLSLPLLTLRPASRAQGRPPPTSRRG